MLLVFCCQHWHQLVAPYACMIANYCNCCRPGALARQLPGFCAWIGVQPSMVRLPTQHQQSQVAGTRVFRSAELQVPQLLHFALGWSTSIWCGGLGRSFACWLACWLAGLLACWDHRGVTAPGEATSSSGVTGEAVTGEANPSVGCGWCHRHPQADITACLEVAATAVAWQVDRHCCLICRALLCRLARLYVPRRLALGVKWPHPGPVAGQT
jgi:hypothetical protein